MGRRRRKKGGFKRFAQGARKTAQVAGKALMLAERLSSLINVEWKIIEVTEEGTDIDNTGNQFWHLTPCAQGDNTNQRDGNRILPKKITVRMNIFKDAAANMTNLLIMVVSDKKQQGTPPTVLQLLEEADYQSYQAKEFTDRWKVWMSKRIFLTTDKPQFQMSKTINFNKPSKTGKGRAWHIDYLGPTDGTGDAGPGQLYILLLSNEPPAGNNPTIDLRTRFKFIDN